MTERTFYRISSRDQDAPQQSSALLDNREAELKVLPRIFLINARSLRSKKKKETFQGLIKELNVLEKADVLAVTETWLKEDDIGGELAINGFWGPFRTDRVPAITGKKRGGGVCLFVNKSWCNNALVIRRICTKDIELLSVYLYPFHQLREIIVTVVYIHPRANVRNASDLIYRTEEEFRASYPDSLNFILGDFNRCSLEGFFQYVSSPTKGNKILDKCYGCIEGAYESTTFPSQKLSDHMCVYLDPKNWNSQHENKLTTRRTLSKEDILSKALGNINSAQELQRVSRQDRESQDAQTAEQGAEQNDGEVAGASGLQDIIHESSFPPNTPLRLVGVLNGDMLYETLPPATTNDSERRGENLRLRMRHLRKRLIPTCLRSQERDT